MHAKQPAPGSHKLQYTLFWYSARLGTKIVQDERFIDVKIFGNAGGSPYGEIAKIA
jgi:hypothetical protein